MGYAIRLERSLIVLNCKCFSGTLCKRISIFRGYLALTSAHYFWFFFRKSPVVFIYRSDKLRAGKWIKNLTK